MDKSKQMLDYLVEHIDMLKKECLLAMMTWHEKWYDKATGSSTVVSASVSIIMPLLVLCCYNETVSSFLQFSWTCFVKPFGTRADTNNQQDNLESFYKSQAGIYDKTRSVLLQGRELSLKLSLNHLYQSTQNVWVDIGGGTGSNIYEMSKNTDLCKTFSKIYIIDLSPSLCEVAKARCQQEGWKNVEVICGDASDFTIEEDAAQLVTFSYSLSMIPSFHAAIDHALAILDRKNGIISCVDFGVSSSSMLVGRVNTLGGMLNRHVPWFYRTFWRIWFEFDKVFLDPSRREYLEYRFGTIKSLNCYNRKLGNIPYYIWIGCDKEHEQHLQKRFVDLGPTSPYLAPMNAELDQIKPVTKATVAAVRNSMKILPFPSLFYQKEYWRVYYDELDPIYSQFNNSYIYAFTWEDPREDAKILNFQPTDTVLAITSAGDNLLHYACLPNGPKRIHGVDLNPCQGHLTELKLASFKALDRELIWKIFGEGKIHNFRELLITKLASHLSSNAFQYWYENGPTTFDINGPGLYDTGFTKWALRLARYIFKISGLSAEVTKLCNATSLKEQKEIWNNKIKPVLFNRFVGKVLVGNPVFLWSALGVPKNQAKMMDSSILNYIIDTLDPVIGRSLISNDNYFYYLTLQGHYSKNNCPDYLTPRGYNALTQFSDSPLDRIRLHTDTLKDVCERLSKKTVSIAIIMDHMDWFDQEKSDVEEEIEALWKALDDYGRVMLRSAAKKPWYIERFEKFGFHCKAYSVRYPGKCIDRVNMYASTWICQKIKTKNDGMVQTPSSFNLDE